MREKSIHSGAHQKSTNTTARIFSIFSNTETLFGKCLQHYGCATIPSIYPNTRANYYFIIGTPDYVKSIYDTIDAPYTSVFIVTQSDSTISSLLKHVESPLTRVALVNTFVLTEQAIQSLFAFFFVSDTQIQHFSFLPQNNHHSKPDPDGNSNTNRRESDIKKSQNLHEITDDKRRISVIINNTYRKQRRLPLFISRFRNTHFSIKISVLFVSFPLFMYVFSVYVALFFGLGCLKLFSEGKFASSKSMCFVSKLSTLTARSIYTLSSPLLYVPYVGQTYKNQQHSLDTLKLIVVVYDESSNIATRILHTTSSPGASSISLIPLPSPDIIGSLDNAVSSLQTNVGLLRAELAYINEGHIFPLVFPLHTITLQIQDKLNIFYDYVHKSSVFLKAYPELFGMRKDSSYALFFQNSRELRPTGGFLGSLGFISASEGSVSDVIIRDVYDLDGQLKGHIEPPDPIRLLLGNEHWYLRDSNWEYDIPLAAKQMVWFTEKETGQELRGAVLLNTSVLESLLSLVGPTRVPDYDIEISAQNVVDIITSRVQSDFFPGSTQKRDFLSALFRALIEKAASADKSVVLKVVRILLTKLDTRDIAIYTKDDQLETLLSSAGWTGSVSFNNTCEQGRDCFSLFTYPVEANLGVNKVNKYLKRDDESVITISDSGEVRQTVQLKYTNSAQNVPTTGGEYKTYLRMIFPKDALLKDISIDSYPVYKLNTSQIEQPSSLTLPYYEALLDETNGNTVVGIGFAVPPQGSSTVNIHVQYAHVFSFLSEGIFMVRYLRQPGVDYVSWRGTINYPSSWGASLTQQRETVGRRAETIIAKPGQIQYNNNLSHDNVFNVMFTK